MCDKCDRSPVLLAGAGESADFWRSLLPDAVKAAELAEQNRGLVSGPRRRRAVNYNEEKLHKEAEDKAKAEARCCPCARCCCWPRSSDPLLSCVPSVRSRGSPFCFGSILFRFSFQFRRLRLSLAATPRQLNHERVLFHPIPDHSAYAVGHDNALYPSPPVRCIGRSVDAQRSSKAFQRSQAVAYLACCIMQQCRIPIRQTPGSVWTHKSMSKQQQHAVLLQALAARCRLPTAAALLAPEACTMQKATPHIALQQVTLSAERFGCSSYSGETADNKFYAYLQCCLAWLVLRPTRPPAVPLTCIGW